MTIVMGLLAMAGLAAATPTPPQVLPTRYEAGHFYAVPETRDGQRMKLVVDTGGAGANGMYWITRATADRLHLHTRICSIGSHRITVAPTPDYRPGHALPPPGKGACGASVIVIANQGGPYGDGQLGAGYLPGRVWTFDYPHRRLTLEGSGWRPTPAAHATPLHFPRNAMGGKASGFARIVIKVDGQPLGMLLDTGATAHPTPDGEKASGTPVTARDYGVTSYITTSMLERWHKAHPHWRVVKNGDDLFGPKHPMRLIEVPHVEIAGWSVGPVWFTERPDRNFHVFMSSMMDKQVEGAVGANIFRHFAMTLDYPRETAYFRCERGCKAAARQPPGP